MSAALPGPSSQPTGTAIEASPISYSSHDCATPSRRIRASVGRSAAHVVAVAGVRRSYGSGPAASRAVSSGSWASRHLPSAVQCAGSRMPDRRLRALSSRLARLAEQVDDLAVLQHREVDGLAGVGRELRDVAARDLGQPQAGQQRRHEARDLEPEAEAARARVALEVAALGEHAR